jgi:hypothetical protein
LSPFNATLLNSVPPMWPPKKDNHLGGTDNTIDTHNSKPRFSYVIIVAQKKV